MEVRTCDKSAPAFAQDDIAAIAQSLSPPLTEGLSLFPSSCTRRSPCGSLSFAGEVRAYHVPLEYPHGLGLAFLPVVPQLRQSVHNTRT